MSALAVPPQPTLRDGEVVLRPWTFDDVDPARLKQDQKLAQWFGAVIAPGASEHQLIEQRQSGYADSRRVVSFVVEHRGRLAGAVEVRRSGEAVGELSWAVFPDHRGEGVGTRAVQLLIRYGFDELGLHRLTAHAAPHDPASLRVASRAGLRREGLLRCAAGAAPNSSADLRDGQRGELLRERGDVVQLARLATDPEPTSRDGFIGLLNAGLPTKRLIAQGLIRNNANKILLCELTYKQEWDLPGGVVDPHESPAHAVVREVREEMQVEMSPRSLVAVNWLPPWHGWDDAMLFVFDLGVDDDVIARARLEPRELRAVHWCTLDEVELRVAPYVARLLRRLAQQTDGTAYLEEGADPLW